MLNRIATAFFALLLLAGAALTAQAQTGETEIIALLKQRDREIKSVLGTDAKLTAVQREQLKDLVNGVIDFERMSEDVLGPHWADLTEAQRTEFVEVFSTIVRAQSLADLDIYRATVAYDDVTIDGETAMVQTTTVYKETPANVAYTMGYHDAQWWVLDFSIDEVGTVEGYQRTFQKVVRTKGFDALMKSLRKKQAKMEAAASS